MKITDVIEGYGSSKPLTSIKPKKVKERYGVMDEPSYGTSKANVRQQTSTQANMIKRTNNKNQDMNRELTIANKSLQRRQNRLSIKQPTGIPNRPQQQTGQQG